jgi:glutathione S-transferase
MLKLWGRISSINVRKVVFTAQLLEIPFERIDAGAAFGIVQTPEYKRKNPNSLVPAIDDGAFSLFESNVIVRYLCAKHAPGRLYPESLQARFDAERWMDWQQTTLNPASRPAFWQLIRTPPEQRQDDVIAESNAAIESLMATLDAHLAQRSYMVGERFTVADIPLACEVHRWFGLPQPRQSRPNIERWYDSIRARQPSMGVLDMALS